MWPPSLHPDFCGINEVFVVLPDRPSLWCFETRKQHQSHPVRWSSRWHPLQSCQWFTRLSFTQLVNHIAIRPGLLQYHQFAGIRRLTRSLPLAPTIASLTLTIYRRGDFPSFRPATGNSPMHTWAPLGRNANRWRKTDTIGFSRPLNSPSKC